MSAYGYGPPPPPPAAAGGHTSHGRPNAPYQHGQGRGGGGSHPRGGSGNRGRGGHHNNHRGDYRGPTVQPHFEYAAQAYPQHGAGSYGGAHPPPGNYPPAQPHWSPEHAHAQPPHSHAHGSVPIASSGYHPNYPPQPYPPTQYPATVPSYAPPPQYPHAYQAPQHQSPNQWDGQGPPHQPPPYGPGRHRGSYGDRGAAKGTPGRQGFEHQAPPPVANGAYGHPYTPDQAAHHPAQYPYPGPPPPPGPAHQDSYYVQQPRRGRGGAHRDGNVRSRGGHHTGDRSRQHKQGHNNNNHNNHQKNDKQDKQNKQEPPSAAKKKKRKVNTLGLTPAMDSESEDDEGEEKVLSEMIGQESLAVKDVDAFLAERRKNFPTKARVEARKAAELARSKEDETELLEKQAKQLRRQLAKVEVSIKRKREQGDEGDEMREASSGESSDDDKPEVMSSRPQGPQPPSQPDKKADISRHCKYYSTGGTCGKKGKCRFVHDPEVREAAIKEREANNGRLTIQQRLILNDKEQEDLTVLQSIQYLRAKGLMPAVPATEAKEKNPTQIKVEEIITKLKPAPTTSLLPAASPSLPPLPVKREGGSHRRNQPPPSIIPSANSISTQGMKHYQGWLLKPYGSSNGTQSKSDDLP